MDAGGALVFRGTPHAVIDVRRRRDVAPGQREAAAALGSSHVVHGAEIPDRPGDGNLPLEWLEIWFWGSPPLLMWESIPVHRLPQSAWSKTFPCGFRHHQQAALAT